MKAFGVRLAAGAMTILFGAYAAALAQKDKQVNPQDWSAEAPALGQPADPIADITANDWIAEPADQIGNGSAQETLDQAVKTAAPIQADSTIQLVQHSEDASADPQKFAAMPEVSITDRGAENNTIDEIPVPDWTLPADGGATDAITDNQAESHSSPQAMTLPDASGASLPQKMNDQLPELEIAENPATEFQRDAGSNQTSADVPATASLGNPTNMLREPDASGNMLRDQAPGNAISAQARFADPSRNAQPAGLPTGQPAMSDQQLADQWIQEQGVDNTERSEPARVAELANPVTPQPFVPETPGNQLSPNSFAAGDRLSNQPNADLDSGIAETSGNAAKAMPNQLYQAQPAGYQQSANPMLVDPTVTIDAPGDRRLEGVQSPSVVIQKRAPNEVKVGQPATFVIHVQNVGAVEALDVVVQDKIPAGMRLIDASPQPVQQQNHLLWQLGSMPAGDERTVTMQLVPEQEGELGSVARVSFEAAASVRTIATRPELKIIQNAPETVLIGQQLEIELEVSNPGTGEATNVVLQEDVPEGLEHPKGRQLDNALGNLAPGEIRRQVLRMKAVAPGLVQNTIRLTADDGLVSEHTVAVQVVAPELKVALEGPSRRFLERQATYHVHVGNVGTADATNVELAVQLDRGFTFVSTENQGVYDPSRHSVHWSLARMPAGGNAQVALTLLPVQEGEQAIVLDARADLGTLAKDENRISVEGFSELSFSISNPGGPIELGSDTTYVVNVTNSGSKADSNIRVQLVLPPGLKLLSADGDAGTDGRGLVEFQPKATLAPGSEHQYRIRVQGVAPGTHIVKAVVVSNLATTPVTKEESTVVYADQDNSKQLVHGSLNSGEVEKMNPVGISAIRPRSRRYVGE